MMMRRRRRRRGGLRGPAPRGAAPAGAPDARGLGALLPSDNVRYTSFALHPRRFALHPRRFALHPRRGITFLNAFLMQVAYAAES